MFCGECGTKNTGGSQFCENCGAKLEQANVDANSTAKAFPSTFNAFFAPNSAISVTPAACPSVIKSRNIGA